MKHFLPILFSTLIFGFSFFAGSQVSAEDAVPPPTVPCNKVRPDGWPPPQLNWTNSEFHSLRPYQASPCNAAVSDTAIFCGDTLTFNDNIDETFDPPYPYPPYAGCTEISPGNVRCNYSDDRNANVNIDLSGAELPIMGNTEDVINSQNRDSETLNDAAKVNGYVSWYLNGTVNRAEYSPLDVRPDCIGETTQIAGVCLNTLPVLDTCLSPNPLPLLPDIPNPLLTADGTVSCGGLKSCCVTKNRLAEKVDILDHDKLINYSGPLNKLLPEEVQQQQRAQTVKDAVSSLPPPTGTNAEIRHDQIVGCTYGIDIPLFGQLFAIPGPCYNPGLIGKILDKTLIKSRRLSDFTSRPPIRSDFPDYIDYEHRLAEWRGKDCIEVKVPHWVPIIGGKGIIWCFENLLIPNYVAQLYPNIPLSSTEDSVGKAEGGATVGTVPPDVTISNFEATSSAATLYFSHMEEAKDLAELLQKTYVPKGVNPSAPGDSVPVQISNSCKIVEVRSGVGDSLFAGDIDVKIKYHADFSCDFQVPYCSASNVRDCIYGCIPDMTEGICKTHIYCSPDNLTLCASSPYYGCSPNETGGTCRTYSYEPFCSEDNNNTLCDYGCTPAPYGGYCNPPPPPPVQYCTKSIPIAVNITTKTPLVDNIWTRLVSGTSSIFRRMSPKLGTGTGLGEVKDIPASTKVTYKGTLNGESVESIGQLNFPHIGGISEYFLKGIQTMLRPKGFGEPISFGTPAPSIPPGTNNCVVNIPDSNVPSKYLGSFKSNFIDLANRWATGCTGADNNMADECYNWVVSTAIGSGVNPAFALTIWLNESGASNYCAGGPTTQDFGINLPALYKNIGEQLRVFSNMAKMKLCDGMPGFVEPMHGWMSRFQSNTGVCNPNDPVATKYYTDVMATTWSWVSGCPRNGKFGITWPTDMICP